MCRLRTVALLLVIALPVTAADAGGFRSPSMTVAPRPLHSFPRHFVRRGIFRQFSAPGVVGVYGIGDLSDAYVEYPPQAAPTAPPAAAPNPPIVDLPPCREEAPGGVSILRGGSCLHRQG